MTDQTRDTRDIETVEAVQVEDDPEATEKHEKPESSTGTKRPPRDRSRMLRKVKLVPAILIVLLLISGGSAAWLYFKQYKPGQQTNPDVARTVVGAASDGTVALLSYSPESLDKDFAAAKSHLTGDFLSYYNQFTQEIVAPAAKQKSLKTTAHIVGAAVQELHPDSAVVLVFVDQSTTSKDKPDPSMASSNVLVSMTRVNSHWLITKFDPI
jgi:Mce-associated membrane protein